MKKNQKLCFVIMGYGKKTDFDSGRTFGLDKTYQNIIKPAAEKAGLQCFRADEIHGSGLIDNSMYALLMHADVVVADITTFNPNAIYELGIRHAVRPYSTIIIREQHSTTPFNLDHTRIFKYAHLGDDIGFDEANRCTDALSNLIESVLKKQEIDSPLYGYIKDIDPPKLTQKEYQRIIGDLSNREATLFAISERAKHCMKNSNFIEAASFWEKAENLAPNEPYYTQQHALAKYKSESPPTLPSLIDALQIIKKLDPDGDTNDPETLGLTGAIYKRMWLITNEFEYLNRAIKFYGKGFQIRRDYYNGENYALCLNLAASIENDPEDKAYYSGAAKSARKEILGILKYLSSESTEFTDHKAEEYWPYATLANCYFGLGDRENGLKYEKIFLDLVSSDWEKETYFESKRALTELIDS